MPPVAEADELSPDAQRLIQFVRLGWLLRRACLRGRLAIDNSYVVLLNIRIGVHEVHHQLGKLRFYD